MLRTLLLSYNQVGDEGAIALAEVVVVTLYPLLFHVLVHVLS